MKESMLIDIQAVLKDTFFAQKDISFREMGEFCKSPSNLIQFIYFNNSIIQELHINFPVLNIKDALGTRFDKINRLAITESLYNKIGDLLNRQYTILSKYQPQIALIVCFGISNNDRPKFHNEGKTIKVLSELSKLKKLLQEKVEVDLGFINPEESETETVKDYSPKYLIKKVKVELASDDEPDKSITIYDKNYPVEDKVKLDFLLVMAFEEVFKKLKIVDNYEKINRNHLFCQQFFNFINNQTPFSTKHNYSERQILKLFTKVYKLTGHTFLSLSKITTNDNVELEIEIVEKWLKPSHK